MLLLTTAANRLCVLSVTLLDDLSLYVRDTALQDSLSFPSGDEVEIRAPHCVRNKANRAALMAWVWTATHLDDTQQAAQCDQILRRFMKSNAHS